MTKLAYQVVVPQTLQELDEAVQRFQASDFSGQELFCHWQAIRQASLEMFVPEREGDRVPGEHSY